MTKLHFNYKDIFRAFRLGFSAKNIWVGFQGLLFAWLGYAGVTYLAYWVSGVNVADIWGAYRLFPMPGCTFTADWAWWVWIIWAVGVVWFVFVSMVAGIAISKLTYERLRGDEFYEVKEAWKQAIKSAGALIATPILLGLFIVLLLVAGILLGLLGRIPFAGELIVGIFAVFAFAVSLFIVYLIIVFFFTFTISPAVIGTTRSDAFDNLFEVFSCVSDQSWRLIWYQLMLLVFTVVGMAILLFFSAKAVQLGRWVVDLTMNVSPEKAKGAQVAGKLGMMLDHARHIVIPAWVADIKGFFAGIKCGFWKFFVAPPEPVVAEISSGSQTVVLTAETSMVAETAAGAAPVFAQAPLSVKIGSVLFSIAYHIVILFIFAYGTAIWYAGNTLIYLILVRKKDDRNLLEIRDEEIEIPEKIDVTPPEPEKPKKPTAKKKTSAKKPTPTKKKPTRKKKT
ncbi:hypothetical protein JXM67_00095 [candidate division WOR-3 bacterium]|nr:hypothetical protein [candidate division WOR-3 bacterium]